MATAMSETAREAVRVRFLGGFQLTVNGRPVERWRAGKARGLFQYLVIHRGQTLTRDRLYEALWPASDRSMGDSSLKVAAHTLRRVLDAHPDGPGTSGIRLLYRDFGYALEVADYWSDANHFQELAHAGLRAVADGQTGLARVQLRAALDLYGGDFLQGENADWVVEQREYLRSLALRVLVVLRADAESREDFSELIAICRRTLEIDRHHEETYRALMAVHGRRGEFARVRSWYQLCARRLRDELATTPSGETERLLREMIPAPAPPWAVRTDRHGIRTVRAGPGRTTGPPPRASMSVKPSSLPARHSPACRAGDGPISSARSHQAIQ